MTAGRECFDLPDSYNRVFAVGDLHGCLKEIEALVNYLERKESLNSQDALIFAGDYIDRGQDSRAVLDYLIAFKDRYPGALFLRGNHEEMLLHFLDQDGAIGWSWLDNGGVQCLESYGAGPGMQLREVLELIPDNHIAFLRGLDRYIVSAEHIFVHAGLDPLRDLYQQRDEDLFWIRSEFVSNIHHFDKTVVFGHTPYEDVMFHLPYKIGIDTGLVYGNKLSCIELKNSLVYQVAAGKKKVVVSDFTAKSVLPVRPWRGKRRFPFLAL